MGNYIDQAAQFFHRFGVNVPPFLPGTVAPGFIEHGSCCLPCGLQRAFGICVVCHDTEVILIVAQPAAYHTVWLQSVH